MKVAIVGTGTLGTSIALTFSLFDKFQTVYLCRGRANIEKDVEIIMKNKFNKLESKNLYKKDFLNNSYKRITFCNVNEIKDADLVIEAVIEDFDVKTELFQYLDSVCDENTLFATNTSSIPISKLEHKINRPLIGMHFFNPANVMKLVEIITTKNTDEHIINYVQEVVADINKVSVLVKDSPGFIVNRLLIPMINEAADLYISGIATAEDIDKAMQLGANHPMGPLALADLIGIDIVYSIMAVLYQETGKDKYYPSSVLKKMVDDNQLGRKTGNGFYVY